MAWGRLLFLAAAALACAGCVNMNNPARLAPGASADEIRQLLGEPTGRYPLPGGAQRLEYARGPYGKQTWMIDVDAGGRLASATQVLTERQFNAIQAGATADEVLRTIGRPSNTGFVGWQRTQTVWSYRYASPFCQWFQVGLSEAGIVEDTGYGPDPLCDDVDKPLLGIFPAMNIVLYGIPNCDTVKKARAWLDERGLAYAFHDYKKLGVPQAEATAWMARHGWEKLLNRRGPTWRKLDPARQAAVTDAVSALALMNEQSSVIRRPVLVRGDTVLVGFDADEWSGTLG